MSISRSSRIIDLTYSHNSVTDFRIQYWKPYPSLENNSLLAITYQPSRNDHSRTIKQKAIYANNIFNDIVYSHVTPNLAPFVLSEAPTRFWFFALGAIVFEKYWQCLSCRNRRRLGTKAKCYFLCTRLWRLLGFIRQELCTSQGLFSFDTFIALRWLTSSWQTTTPMLWFSLLRKLGISAIARSFTYILNSAAGIIA